MRFKKGYIYAEREESEGAGRCEDRGGGERVLNWKTERERVRFDGEGKDRGGWRQSFKVGWMDGWMDAGHGLPGCQGAIKKKRKGCRAVNGQQGKRIRVRKSVQRQGGNYSGR